VTNNKSVGYNKKDVTDRAKLWKAFIFVRYALTTLLSNKQRTTNNEQQTTNNEQQTTNNKQQTLNSTPIFVLSVGNKANNLINKNPKQTCPTTGRSAFHQNPH